MTADHEAKSTSCGSPVRVDHARVGQLAEVGMQTALLLHEIRQPLTALTTALQLSQQEQGAARDEMVGEALAQLRRMDEMLGAALGLVDLRRGEQRASRVELAPLVRRIMYFVGGAARRGQAQLILELEDVPPVRAVERQLEQILFNLVNNARDSLAAKGEGGRLAVVLRSTAQTAELVVADDGLGIDEQWRDAIFDPFVSTKDGGTGLGLYVARQLAAEAGGTLVLCTADALPESLQPPPVTAFALRLPLATE